MDKVKHIRILPTGEFWEYTPETDSWVELPPHPGGGRWAPGSFVLEGGVYFTCGESNVGNRRDLMRYQIEGAANVETVEKNQLSIYPNPARQTFQIGQLSTVEQIEILDASGAIVLTEMVSPNSLVDISQLQPGIYFCRLRGNEGLRTEKLIVE